MATQSGCVVIGEQVFFEGPIDVQDQPAIRGTPACSATFVAHQAIVECDAEVTVNLSDGRSIQMFVADSAPNTDGGVTIRCHVKKSRAS